MKIRGRRGLMKTHTLFSYSEAGCFPSELPTYLIFMAFQEARMQVSSSSSSSSPSPLRRGEGIILDFLKCLLCRHTWNMPEAGWIANDPSPCRWDPQPGKPNAHVPALLAPLPRCLDGGEAHSVSAQGGKKQQKNSLA